MSRSGLTGFVAGLARQVADKGVTINNILPGAFDTDRLRSGLAFAAGKAGRDVADVERERLAEIPAGRFGTQEELAELAAWLVCDGSEWMRGEIVTFDGGEWLRGAGEFNDLLELPPQVWEQMRAMRESKKK